MGECERESARITVIARTSRKNCQQNECLNMNARDSNLGRHRETVTGSSPWLKGVPGLKLLVFGLADHYRKSP